MYHALIDYDSLIKEDNPYFDLTSHLMGIGDDCGRKAEITYYTREDCRVCGTEEAEQVFSRLGIETVKKVASGKDAAAGSDLITGRGNGYDVMTAWKVCQNILDHTSGIATKTANFVKKVHDVNPEIAVLTTRKMFPGTKALAMKGIIAGGASPHRLGVSESILVFDQHIELVGGIDAFIDKFKKFRYLCCEKKVLFETSDLDLALRLLSIGMDGIQIEKLSPEAAADFADGIRREFPNATLLAAGGINENNAAEYAKADINAIVTTSLYTAKPVDIGTRIIPAE